MGDSVFMERTTPGQLDYAPRALPFLKRAKVRRVLVSVGLACAGVGALLWAPFLVEQTERIVAQWRCLRYSAPASEEVVREDKSGDFSLWSKPGMVQTLVETSHVGPIDGAVLFLHGRSVGARPKRLVVVTLITGGWVETKVIELRTFRHMYFRSMNRGVLPGCENGYFFKDFRVFAGQADPKDSSHFTIEYELEGKREIVDGWLVDNEFEYVRLERRGAINNGWWKGG